MWEFIDFSWNLYESSLYAYMVTNSRSFRACTPGNSAAVNISNFVIRLFRPSTFFCLVGHSLSLCHKLIRPDLSTLKCCQKLIFSSSRQGEGCTKLTSLRPPSGWFCNYAQSEDHRRKNSQCDDFVHNTFNICASNISRHDSTVKRIPFNICVLFSSVLLSFKSKK